MTSLTELQNTDTTSALGGRDHVRRDDGQGVPVVRKAVRHLVGAERRDLFLEASLQLLASRLLADVAGTPVPAPLECTPERLTTELVDGAVTAERLFDEPDELVAQCASAGRLLGDLHRKGRDSAVLLPAATPEDPQLDPIPYETVADHPVARLDLAAAVHGRGLHERLTPEPVDAPVTFVHGDFKYDNVLLRPGRTPVVIDWECAGQGVAIVDVAAFCASLLSESVRLGAVEAEHGAARGLHRLDETTSTAWRCIAAFRAAHRDALADDEQLAALTPDRLVLACARSLLTRAVVYTDLVGSYDRMPRSLVQIATNMAARPSLFHGRFA